MNAAAIDLANVPGDAIERDLLRRGLPEPVVKSLGLVCPPGCSEHVWAEDHSWMAHRASLTSSTGGFRGWIDVVVCDNGEVSAPAMWIADAEGRFVLEDELTDQARALEDVLQRLLDLTEIPG